MAQLLVQQLIVLTSPNYNVEVAKTHVEGVVVDANGAPLIGVSVVQDGTSNGFVTDMDGTFRFLFQLIQP